MDLTTIRRFYRLIVEWVRQRSHGDRFDRWGSHLSRCADLLLRGISALLILGLTVYALILAVIAVGSVRLAESVLWRLRRWSNGVGFRWRKVLSAGVALLLLSFLAVFVVAGLVYLSYTADFRSPEEVIAASGQGSSRLYDREGRPLYEFIDPVGGVRKPTPLSEISPYLIAATIATEDASFYDNPGVNITGLLRAIKSNLPPPIGEGFGKGSGGSSITQQLVKNVYLTPEERFDRRIERKIKETVLALELKRRYSDDQILEWYLNQVDYGNFAIGAEAAAQRYFGKPASELTLAEAALLAGIPQAPALYTPALAENGERAIARQHLVLDLIWKHRGKIKDIVGITRDDIEAAKQEPLQFVEPRIDIQAPHFVFYVQEVATKMCERGVLKPRVDVPCDKVMQRGGLDITTSLNLDLQRMGEDVVEEVISANEARHNGHNGAIVALNPHTGEILAMVGSRDFFREAISGQVNIVTSLRSHGSAMKVFTYLTAFKQGWVPSTRVRDAPLAFADGRQVNNWNFAYQGKISVREALAESVNVPAVRTVMEMGIEEVEKTAHQLGITSLRDRDCGPTITLGSCEVKLLDMAFAYATIANNGVMKGMPSVEDLPQGFREMDPVAVISIEDSQGNVLYQYQDPVEKEVIKPAYAYMITDILSKDAIRWSGLTLPFPAASKTGTSEGFKDNVVLGYNPDVVVGVWMGNTDGAPMADGTFSSAGAGPMWRRFMEAASQHLGLAARAFPVPSDVALVDCGPRQEVFASNEVPATPSSCLREEKEDRDRDEDREKQREERKKEREDERRHGRGEGRRNHDD